MPRVGLRFGKELNSYDSNGVNHDDWSGINSTSGGTNKA